MWYSFFFIIILFLIIGLLSYKKSNNTVEDYVIGSKSMNPILVGLSASSSILSGYMFTGFIGLIFVVGLEAIWWAVGGFIGDYITSLVFHKRIKEDNDKIESNSLLSYILSKTSKHKNIIMGLVLILSLIFLGTFSAAQLNATAKTINILDISISTNIGIIITGIIILIYSFFGGFRASVWTDVVQAIVMLISMIILLIFSINHLGGIENIISSLSNLDNSYFDFFTEKRKELYGDFIGPILFVLGCTVSGFGVIGQPHIMVRFLSVKNRKEVDTARFYYYLFYWIFFISVICFGLMCRLLIDANSVSDGEQILPIIASKLLPSTLLGIVIAGIFSATSSTADSLVLSCSSSIVEGIEIFTNKTPSYLTVRIITISVILFSCLIGIYGSHSVFKIVLLSWAVLGSSFAPIISLFAFKIKINDTTIIAIIISGFLGTVIWYFMDMSYISYEIIAGIIFSYFTFIIFKLLEKFKIVKN